MRLLLAVAAVVLAPLPALAEKCPEGSRTRGDTCVQDGCTSDAECGAGRVCKEVPLCVNSGIVTAACGSGNVCAVGTCSKDKRCITDTKGNKCGCSAGVPGEAAVYVGGIAVLAICRRAAWGRRRGARRPP